ncbi:MAG: L,D-transpeptidase [Bacteroidota bacterium]
MTRVRALVFVLIPFIMMSCKQQKEQNVPQSDVPVLKKVDIDYRMIALKDSIKKVLSGLDSLQKTIVFTVNRVDAQNMVKLDTVIIPANLNEHLYQYLPYPFEVPYLKDIDKIIFFSYPAQAFGAYKNGKLVYTGPTSMGRKADKTPTGLFYTNWKAEKTTSTFNDEWELKWNFNIENDSGVGFHEYAMPGYPASHSCLRLTEKDAKYMYEWADEWELKGTDSVVAKGTPVVVFGSYPFGGPKPWFQLSSNSKALDISPGELQQLVTPFLSDILAAQAKRAEISQ